MFGLPQKQCSPEKIVIHITKDGEAYYAWVEEYGITVVGNTEQEALDAMRRAIRDISKDKRLVRELLSI